MYKVFKEEDGYDTLIETYPYPTLMQLKYYLFEIHHCVTVVGKWLFDDNFTFAFPLTKYNLDYCCIIDNETNGTNFCKKLSKEI